MSMADKCPYCGAPDPTILHQCSGLHRHEMSATHANPIVPMPDEHAGCRKQIHALERGIGELETRFVHLQQIYNKLADQWNVFQSLNKPDNRNIQRAEGAGEMARRLAEVLLGVAYEKDTREILRKLLEDLDAPAGQEVEVSQKLSVTHRVK